MKTPATIHATYLVIIALACLGAIVSIDFGDVAFFRRLTYALIIAALAVSILSIVYVFLSNTTIPTTLKEMERISVRIHEAAQQFDMRPESVKEFEALSGLIRTESQRLSQEIQTLTAPTSKKSDNDLDNLSTRVLDASAPMGLVLLYAVSLAFKQQKNLELKVLCQTVALPEGSEFYFQGWILAMTTTGLFKTRFDDQLTAIIEYVHPSLQEGIQKRIPEKIAQLKETGDEAYATNIMATVAQLEKFFEP
ncbi:MAG: hypothetical protein HQL75_13315 [Magnetococcales bacterium]|nr:hypothetical protein [Magnetococcales bacterium]